MSKVEENPTNSDRSKRPNKKDIINEAKRNLTDPNSANHFALWAKLYEEMSAEEFTVFHTTLKLKKYQPNELIIARGDLQAPLFLLNSGTVNLVRNLRGEEVTLSPIGPGDLIGSDIFLTGEAWNLSLYAKDVVSAHVFDLEQLLKLQVDFPNLAEKIFTFCSRYDVLQNMLRILDTPTTAGTDSTHVKRKNGVKKPGDEKIQQGTIVRKMKGGLCFSLPVKKHEKINIPLKSKLNLSVRLSSGILDVLSATVVGTIQSVALPTEALVFVRLLLPLDDSQYKCENIEFL